MKYEVGTFRANYYINDLGWTESMDMTEWGDMRDLVEQYDQRPCRVLDCGVEGYADLEFLDGSRLEAIHRAHIYP